MSLSSPPELESVVETLTPEEKKIMAAVMKRNRILTKVDAQRCKKIKSKKYPWKDAHSGPYSCRKCKKSWRLFTKEGVECPLCKARVCEECIISCNEGSYYICRGCYEEILESGKTGDWFHFKKPLHEVTDGGVLGKLDEALKAALSSKKRKAKVKFHARKENNDRSVHSYSYEKSLSKVAEELNEIGTIEGEISVRKTSHQMNGKKDVVERVEKATVTPTPMVNPKAALLKDNDRSYWEKVNSLATALNRWAEAYQEEIEEASDLTLLLDKVVLIMPTAKPEQVAEEQRVSQVNVNEGPNAVKRRASVYPVAAR